MSHPMLGVVSFIRVRVILGVTRAIGVGAKGHRVDQLLVIHVLPYLASVWSTVLNE